MGFNDKEKMWMYFINEIEEDEFSEDYSYSSYNKKSNNKWSFGFFLLMITILCVVGMLAEALLGELFATLLIIIIGVVIYKLF